MTTQTHTMDSVLARTTVRRAPSNDQHTAHTPAGGAIITRIELTGPHGGRVFEYEIETLFTGDRIRYHNGYASFTVAKCGVARLAADCLNENATTIGPRA